MVFGWYLNLFIKILTRNQGINGTFSWFWAISGGWGMEITLNLPNEVII